MEITGAADAGQPIQLRLPTDPLVPDSHHNSALWCCGMTCKPGGNIRFCEQMVNSLLWPFGGVISPGHLRVVWGCGRGAPWASC
jgi:hypothetical protein